MRIGEPGRHFAGQHSFADRLGPRPSRFVVEQRHRRDVVGAVAGNAAAIQDRRHIRGEGWGGRHDRAGQKREDCSFHLSWPQTCRVKIEFGSAPSREGETRMKDSTKDETKGAFHEAKGKIKEKAGRATNNHDLVAEGENENLAGKVQKKVGQVKKVFGK